MSQYIQYAHVGVYAKTHVQMAKAQREILSTVARLALLALEPDETCVLLRLCPIVQRFSWLADAVCGETLFFAKLRKKRSHIASEHEYPQSLATQAMVRFTGAH
jgi:hypothetical protein